MLDTHSHSEGTIESRRLGKREIDFERKTRHMDWRCVNPFMHGNTCECGMSPHNHNLSLSSSTSTAVC